MTIGPVWYGTGAGAVVVGVEGPGTGTVITGGAPPPAPPGRLGFVCVAVVPAPVVGAGTFGPGIVEPEFVLCPGVGVGEGAGAGGGVGAGGGGAGFGVVGADGAVGSGSGAGGGVGVAGGCDPTGMYPGGKY